MSSTPGMAVPKITEGFRMLAEEITEYPDYLKALVEGLEDSQLLAADAWFGGKNVALAQEVKARAERYEQVARRFAAVSEPKP